jgi:hypothetical protein
MNESRSRKALEDARAIPKYTLTQWFHKKYTARKNNILKCNLGRVSGSTLATGRGKAVPCVRPLSPSG